MRSAQDVDPIDLERIDNADPPNDVGTSREVLVNLLAQLRRELLRIIQFPVPETFRQDRRSRDDRSSERAAAGLVDPGDLRDAESTQFSFVAETAATIH